MDTNISEETLASIFKSQERLSCSKEWSNSFLQTVGTQPKGITSQKVVVEYWLIIYIWENIQELFSFTQVSHFNKK
jgi:hypothetical protein